jgi:carbon monoxide dehydrogenase subunit G
MRRRRTAKEEIMLRFEGDRRFPRPLSEVREKMGDARFLAKCIPDVESVSEQEPGRARLVIRPGFAFARGTLHLDLQVSEGNDPSSVRVRVLGKGIGSSSDVEATLHFVETEQGTHIHWVAEVLALGGLLKAVPQGLIRGAAEKVVSDAWTAAEKQLAQGTQ